MKALYKCKNPCILPGAAVAEELNLGVWSPRCEFLSPSRLTIWLPSMGPLVNHNLVVWPGKLEAPRGELVLVTLEVGGLYCLLAVSPINHIRLWFITGFSIELCLKAVICWCTCVWADSFTTPALFRVWDGWDKSATSREDWRAQKVLKRLS